MATMAGGVALGSVAGSAITGTILTNLPREGWG